MTRCMADADRFHLARTLDLVERVEREAVCMQTLVGDLTGRPLAELLEMPRRGDADPDQTSS